MSSNRPNRLTLLYQLVVAYRDHISSHFLLTVGFDTAPPGKHRLLNQRIALEINCQAYQKSIQINIQIRAIEAVAAVGTGYLAIRLVHLVSATVTDVSAFSP